MKKLILCGSLLAALSGALAARAQTDNTYRNVVRLSPLGLVNKLRVHYERVLSPNVSAGILFSSYYGMYDGARIDPFVRIYFGSEAPIGFYLQAKGAVGSFRADFDYTVEKAYFNADGIWDSTSTTYNEKNKSRSFGVLGGGAGFGYQGYLDPKKRITIDLFAGLQLLPLPRKVSSFEETTLNSDGSKIITTRKHEEEDIFWYLTGPGSVFNSMVSVGYHF